MSDAAFNQVISAVADYNRRPQPLTAEERRAAAAASRKKNPLHIKAVAKRRKAKRGGPR